MQNPTQKCRQISSVFKKQGIFSKKLQTLASSNYHVVKYFLLKCFLLANINKTVFGIVPFVYILSYLQKLRERWFLDTTLTRFLHFY